MHPIQEMLLSGIIDEIREYVPGCSVFCMDKCITDNEFITIVFNTKVAYIAILCDRFILSKYKHEQEMVCKEFKFYNPISIDSLLHHLSEYLQ